MPKRKTTLIKLKKGKLPSKKVIETFVKFRRAGFSIKQADILSRVIIKKEVKK